MFKTLLVLPFICISTLSLWAQPIVNEVCPANEVVYSFPGTGASDWVEIFNPTAVVVNLDDFYLSNDSAELAKWNLPDLSINPGVYFLIPAIKDASADTIIPFGLKRKGDYLLLTDGVVILQSVSWTEVRADHSFGLLSGSFFLFTAPTPGTSNSTTAYKGYAEKPEFALSSGVLAAPQLLSLSAPADHEIFYFLNGQMSELPQAYSVPLNIDKTVTISAFCSADSLIDSRLAYASYFFGVSHSLPVVNLHLDSLTLFDDSTGIYMLGYDYTPVHPYWGANYWKDTLITVFFEYYDQEMNRQVAVECDLKIHGGTSSRVKPMKALRLICQNKYEEDNFEYPFFSNKAVNRFDKLILRNAGGDFNKAHMKDGVFHKLAIDENLDIDVQAYQPVVVYINGHYWGVQELRERTDKSYFQINYDADPKTLNLLEEDELIAIEGDSTEFVELSNLINTSDMGLDVNYDSANLQLDMTSLADYFVYELFLNNRDWPYNNMRLWNSPEHPRYRYILNDLDGSAKYFGNDPLDLHSLETIMGSWGDSNVHILIFRSLLVNAEFKRYFVNRYADLMNTSFSASLIQPFIDSAKQVIAPEMAQHFAKWPWPPYNEWETNVEKLKDFFTDRVDIVRNELSVVFGLPQSTEVYFGIYPRDAGSILCNTILLNEFPFKGDYFSTNAIDLRAEEQIPGTFLYWENITTSEIYVTQTIQIDPREGDSIIAVFAPKEKSFGLNLYPNPVSEEAILSYSLADSGPVEIRIHDLSGQVVYGLNFEYQAFGAHEIELKLPSLAAGTYVLVIRGASGRDGIKFVSE